MGLSREDLAAIMRGVSKNMQEQLLNVQQELQHIKVEQQELTTGMEVRFEELGRKMDSKIGRIEQRVGKLERVDFDPQRTIAFGDMPVADHLTDIQLVSIIIEEADVENVTIQNVARLSNSNMVQCELCTTEEKIRCSRNKNKMQEISGTFVRSAKSHAERTNEQNFKTLLNIIPGGNDYKITANGKMMKKSWIGGTDGSEGGQSLGHRKGATGRGRGGGIGTPLQGEHRSGGNKQVLTTAAALGCPESPTTQTKTQESSPVTQVTLKEMFRRERLKRSRTTMEWDNMLDNM